MAYTVETFGSQTCIIGTEHTLYTMGAAKTFVLTLDLVNASSAVGAPDVFEVRILEKCLTAGTNRIAYFQTYVGPQGSATAGATIKKSIPIPVGYGGTITLKQTAGTGRVVDYRVDSL